jgi:hypothetical protein
MTSWFASYENVIALVLIHSVLIAAYIMLSANRF